jgi:quercetin 2,3-dioxygenase
VRREPGAEARVYSGRSGEAAAATLNHVRLTMFDLRMEPGASFTHELPGGDSAFLFVLEGAGRFGAEREAAMAGQTVWFDRAAGTAPSAITMQADERLRLVFFAGPPLGEPVAARGPMVMNTPEQLDQAFADFRAGRF